MGKKAIIIGAGPAGLTAAYELLKKTDVTPIIIEKSGDIGGISKTVNYKGNRIDIGGHRFFSKSDRVMQWWINIMPVDTENEQEHILTYRGNKRPITATSTPKDNDNVMLIRKRLSRIYFLRKFFSYPVQLSMDTLRKLGIRRTISILLSYLQARLRPRKPENNLEDFFINRFGNTLYLLFFKDYTEKVWGVPCTKISAEWGAQRIKGVSIGRAISHALKSLAASKKHAGDISQKNTETSLIEKFLYPKYGPGQLWEEVARQVQEMGGVIHRNLEVQTIRSANGNIISIEAINKATGELEIYEGDYFFSTMPVKEFIAGMGSTAPSNVQAIAKDLQYRDFITVGVLLKKIQSPETSNPKSTNHTNHTILPDTWIYIQEKDVQVGRLQIFNNWSPYMVKDPETIWVGLEYFCDSSGAFWNQPDSAIQATAIQELQKMQLIERQDVLDATVLRMEKTYPAYFGAYERFGEIRQFTDQFENLFLIGRNGMHKYNNSDHSMLTAMVAVDNITAGVTDKANIWSINTEQEYHEENIPVKKEQPKKSRPQPQPNWRHALPSITFKTFLFNNKSSRRFLWIAGLAVLIQFTVFKMLYPFAGFINGDSYVYLQSAYYNLDIGTYPIGYSKFLRLVSVFSWSDTALVALQYLIVQLSALWLVFTLFYFFKPAKFTKWLIVLITLFDPAVLYLSNYVSSDALFLGLSLTWFTSLLWIIYKPTGRMVAFQAVLLLLSFMVRYNALYYPLIAALAFLLSSQSWKAKLASITSGGVLIAAFMLFTTNRYQEQTGVSTFSPFSGWQVANNALYAYRYIDSADVKPVPANFRNLDHVVRGYFDTTKDVLRFPQEILLASTWYMWDPNSPLQKYMNLQFKNDSSSKILKKWASVSGLYSGYGAYLIRQYPAQFATYYLVPNVLNYFAPPLEFLEAYNMDRDTVAEVAKTWFHYKSNKVTTAFNDRSIHSLDFFPILGGVLNSLFLSGLLFFGILGGYKQNRSISYSLVLVAGFWLVNFLFSVLASPIALRFQIFGLMLSSFFMVLMIEYIFNIAFTKTTVKDTNAIQADLSAAL